MLFSVKLSYRPMPGASGRSPGDTQVILLPLDLADIGLISCRRHAHQDNLDMIRDYA